MTARRAIGLLVLASVLATAAVAILVFVAPEAAVTGWLYGVLTVAGIPLGALSLLLTGRLTGGRWVAATEAGLRPAAATMPLIAVLAVPAVLGAAMVYPWAVDPAVVKPAIHAYYLNVPGFILREGAIFLGWSAMTVLVVPRLADERGGAIAGACLILHVIGAYILTFDWLLSPLPHFTSSSFGAIVALDWVLAGFCFAILCLPNDADDKLVNDMGGLLTAGVLGTFYMRLMHLLIIWYGDLPDTNHWYRLRDGNLALCVVVAAIVIGTLLPLAGLVTGISRHNLRRLRATAGLALAGQALYRLWEVYPIAGPAALPSCALALIAAGTVTFAAWLWLRRNPAREVAHGR
ncbi:MAG: hypothetical protein GC201_17040 [Alphaproteobacteria bacterium]|nr:hypothetical protein [Alphaproteobacteria bacterium]